MKILKKAFGTLTFSFVFFEDRLGVNIQHGFKKQINIFNWKDEKVYQKHRDIYRPSCFDPLSGLCSCCQRAFHRRNYNCHWKWPGVYPFWRCSGESRWVYRQLVLFSRSWDSKQSQLQNKSYTWRKQIGFSHERHRTPVFL